MKGFKFFFGSITHHFEFLQGEGGHGVSITPHRDWFVLIMTSVCVSIVLILIAGYLFLLVNESELLSAKNITNPSDSVNRQGLEKALSFFKVKEDRLNTLFNVSPRFVDPSL